MAFILIVVSGFGVHLMYIRRRRVSVPYFEQIDAPPILYVLTSLLVLILIYAAIKVSAIPDAQTMVLLDEKGIKLKEKLPPKEKEVNSRLTKVEIDQTKPLAYKKIPEEVWYADFENGRRICFLVPQKDRELVEQWKKIVLEQHD